MRALLIVSLVLIFLSFISGNQVPCVEAAYVDNAAVVVFYELFTGDMAGLLALPNTTYGEIQEIPCPPGQGYELLENYTQGIAKKIVEDDRMFIYDLQEGRIRERTQNEILDYFKSYEMLSDNWIKININWKGHEMRVETSSTVLGVKFDSMNRQLNIDVGGIDRTIGICKIWVPKDLVTSTQEITVAMDGQPAEFTISEDVGQYCIYTEYVHSYHVLTVTLAQTQAWYSQPLNLALIVIAIVAALGAVYWFRFRR